MSDDESLQWLEELLQETQLQKFFTRIHDDLQVSRLDHFDFVKADDLEKIGMGRPAARRLLDAVKRKRRKSIIGRVSEWKIPTVQFTHSYHMYMYYGVCPMHTCMWHVCDVFYDQHVKSCPSSRQITGWICVERATWPANESTGRAQNVDKHVHKLSQITETNVILPILFLNKEYTSCNI